MPTNSCQPTHSLNRRRRSLGQRLGLVARRTFPCLPRSRPHHPRGRQRPNRRQDHQQHRPVHPPNAYTEDWLIYVDDGQTLNHSNPKGSIQSEGGTKIISKNCGSAAIKLINPFATAVPPRATI